MFNRLVFCLVFTCGFVPNVFAITFNLPNSYDIFDVGQFGGVDYASGRDTANVISPLLFNLRTSTVVSVSVPQYNGHAAISVNVVAIDSSTGTAWIDIDYGRGIGSRTGSVSVNGGVATLNQFNSTNGGSSTAVNAAAGGYGFGLGATGTPSFAQPGGFWTSLVNIGGAIYDAVSSGGVSVAVGSVGNASGGSDAVVFTDLVLTLQHSCGASQCDLFAISSDATYGGMLVDGEVAFLNLLNNQATLVSGLFGTIAGALGGATPSLFVNTAAGPVVVTKTSGLIETYNAWYLRVNGVPLSFVATSVGDARVFNNVVDQSADGSRHVLNYLNPSDPIASTPEPSTNLLIGVGLCLLYLKLRRASQTH